MATFFNLPVPAGNGSGASTIVSALGGTRTVTVDKSQFSGILLLEASNDNVNFASVVRFDSGSQRQVVLNLACKYVRITRSGVVPEIPAVPSVQIGASNAIDGVFTVLPVTPGDGAGASVDISLGGDLITIMGAGTFNRAVYIEGSQDGGVTWSRITDLGRFETARVDNTIATFNRLRTFSEQSGGNDAPVIMLGSMSLSGGGAGVTSINGLTGAITLRSPMLRTTGNTLHIENKNVFELSEPVGVNDIDVDVFNAFSIVLDDNLVMPIPVSTVLVSPQDNEVITFTIQQSGDSSGNTVTWTGGAGGYAFAPVGAAAGVTLAQFQAVQLAASSSNELYKIAFEYKAFENQWYCVALAGEFS